MRAFLHGVRCPQRGHERRVAVDVSIGDTNNPGLMRTPDVHAGEAKTHAETPRSLLKPLARCRNPALASTARRALAELAMLCGFDNDLAAQITQTSNRIRGLLTQIHPTSSAFSGRALTVRRCSICLSAVRRVPRLPPPARRRSPIARPGPLRAWAKAWRPRSFRHWPNKP